MRLLACMHTPSRDTQLKLVLKLNRKDASTYIVVEGIDNNVLAVRTTYIAAAGWVPNSWPGLA